VANARVVSPGYFAAIGTPLLAGRAFTDADVERAPPVAIVDETVARRYWPGESALGKRVRWGSDPSNPYMTVVGVVANVKNASLDEAPEFWVYQPHGQAYGRTMYVLVRAAGAPDALAGALRREVAAIDPGVPVFQVRTMRERMDRSLGTRRLTNALLAGFALAAALLAAVGLYGVIALNVGARTAEFGVRMALGARPGDVRRLVVRQGMALALAGVALGTVAALAATRLLRGLLYGVGAADPPTYAAVAAGLVAVALAACWLPACRATAADPVTALRHE
jgi:putative ABC transport system permease protein